MATLASSLTTRAGPTSSSCNNAGPTRSLGLSSLGLLSKDAVNPKEASGTRSVGGYRSVRFLQGPTAVDLLHSIESLLDAQEERIVARLKQEISSCFERYLAVPAKSYESRETKYTVPSSAISGKESAVSRASVTRMSSMPKASEESQVTPTATSKSLNTSLPKCCSMWDQMTGAQGSLSELRHSSRLWWREPQPTSDWGFTSMLTSFVESKGWMKKNPLSKSAMKDEHRHKTAIQKYILSSHFDTICATMIIANSALLGYQVEYMALGGMNTLPEWFTYMQIIFTLWFTFELLLRVWATGFHFLFTRDWRWNIFDVVIVSVSIIEFFLQVAGMTERGNFAVIRVLRILRLVRVVRVIRVVRFFSELRLMVYSSMKSLKPFFWALCLLLLLVYIVGVQVTQSAIDYLAVEGRSDPLMITYFGTLHTSIYTLFQVVSGGLSWRDPADVLLRIHWGYGLLMAVFVSFTVFAVLNIVTGVFVGTAMQSAQQDQDVVIQDAMNEEDSFACEVLHIFEEADTGHKGYITSEELEAHLKDQRVRAYLHHLALDVPEARGLFNLLDICSTGRVSSHEFLLGCMRLKGPARNVDMASLLYENKRMMSLWSGFMGFMEEQFLYLFASLGIDHPLNEPMVDENSVAVEETCVTNQHCQDSNIHSPPDRTHEMTI